MDMTLVWHKRIFPAFHAVDEYTDNVHARNHQRTERKEHRMHSRQTGMGRVDMHIRHLETEETEYQSNGKRPRITHEYFLLLSLKVLY